MLYGCMTFMDAANPAWFIRPVGDAMDTWVDYIEDTAVLKEMKAQEHPSAELIVRCTPTGPRSRVLDTS